MKRITSRHNAVVAQYRSVERGEDPSLMLLDGARLVSEAIDAGVSFRHVAIALDAVSSQSLEKFVSRLTRLHIEPVGASAGVMAAMSPVRSPSTVVALAERPAHGSMTAFARQTPFVVAAVGVQDPGNLGAIVRAAEAGGASGVFAAGPSADPFGWKALRGSMGSALRLPVAREHTLDRLFSTARRHGCRIVAAVPRGGRDPLDMPLSSATLLLIGGEGKGLPVEAEAAADDRVTIPMSPPVDSLNAATCAALLIYEARRQRLAALSHGLALPARP